jgi:hypothetical protein
MAIVGMSRWAAIVIAGLAYGFTDRPRTCLEPQGDPARLGLGQSYSSGVQQPRQVRAYLGVLGQSERVRAARVGAGIFGGGRPGVALARMRGLATSPTG